MNMDDSTTPSWLEVGIRVAIGAAPMGNNVSEQPGWKFHLMKPWGGAGADKATSVPDQYIYSRYFDIQEFFPQVNVFDTPGFASGTQNTNTPATGNTLWLDVYLRSVDLASPIKCDYMMTITYFTVHYDLWAPTDTTLEVDNPEWDDTPAPYTAITDEGDLIIPV